MNRTAQIIKDCLVKNKAAIMLFVIVTILNGAVFYLYDILLEAFIYSLTLSLLILLLFIVADYYRETKKAKERELLKKNIAVTGFNITKENLYDEDYGEVISSLMQKTETLEREFQEKKQADEEYYMTWVHQIKTPIAVMKLELGEDSEKNREILSELFRIEQYVSMVMDYMRLNSDSNDLIIREYDLDQIIREVLRKYAHQFIVYKLKLDYEPCSYRVITDKKCLILILEQLISNAIKYAPEKEITIQMKENSLYISDTGIGIAKEDIPRIFERGYTGHNGRLEQKSSGLGLYLANKAAYLINCTIKCESEINKGTSFIVSFSRGNIVK